MRSKLQLFSFPLIVLAFAATMLYLRVLVGTRIDPQIAFYTQFCKNKLAWSRKMTQEHGKKVVVCGGSSCAFSIMGMRLLQQHGLPTVNMGLIAQCEATMLARCALGEVSPGDTLIIAIEPTLLTSPSEMNPIACKLGYALGHPEWAYRPWETPFAPYLETILRCNTGWKSFLVFPNVYRESKTRMYYTIAETDASGWQTTACRRKVIGRDPIYGSHLSEDNKRLLQWIGQWCERNGVRVAYSLPWAFWEPDLADAWRRTNLALLKEIAAILPVLKDPRMGVYGERSHYADTLMHLTPEGATLRTDELARQIKAWDVWGSGEMEIWGREHLAEGEKR